VKNFGIVDMLVFQMDLRHFKLQETGVIDVVFLQNGIHLLTRM